MSRFLLATLILIMASASGFAADKLPAPQEAVVLTIEGSIAKSNTADGKAQFDFKMLKDLGVRSFKTKTPWIEGISEFNGVRMSGLMKAVGATGQYIEAFAADGYSNEVPIQDFETYNVLLVIFMNGRMLENEDKGPLWIVYPFDAHPEIDIDDKSAHAVWQLTRIVVK